MGHIVLKKTGSDSLTIDTAFRTIAVVNNITQEVCSISVEELYQYIKREGASMSISEGANRSTGGSGSINGRESIMTQRKQAAKPVKKRSS